MDIDSMGAWEWRNGVQLGCMVRTRIFASGGRKISRCACVECADVPLAPNLTQEFGQSMEFGQNLWNVEDVCNRHATQSQ